jgi:hypothetical protein
MQGEHSKQTNKQKKNSMSVEPITRMAQGRATAHRKLGNKPFI